MSNLANQSIVFEVEDLSPNTLVVTNLVGREAMSQLWEFELDLVSRDKNLDLKAILSSAVRLGLKQGVVLGGERGIRTRWFDGLLTEFNQREAGSGWVRYTAKMVPKLWLLTQFFRSRILLELNLNLLIKEVLDGGASLTGEDFTLVLSAPKASTSSKEQHDPSERWNDVYPKREYTVQYDESDFDFLSRWLEHEGVFYFFENDGDHERFCISDSVSSYVDSRLTLPYRPSSSAGSDDGGENTLYEEEVVRSFGCDVRRHPEKVILKDYNWRTPEEELSVLEEPAGGSPGLRVEYNQHYKVDTQGKELAALRAQEFTCREQVCHATSNSKALRPGHTFTLSDHYNGERYDTTYLVTAVTHRAEQSVDLAAGTAASGSYGNELTLIPADVHFRPERTTPWPSIQGVMHAKIDAPETDGDYAEIDDYGRYRIRFPFDYNLDKNNENNYDSRRGGPAYASRYVRMMQPYAGAESPRGDRSGIHFPLLKGTDVLIVHLDGHPDRPVIAGAVPNPDTLSPVTAENYMSNKIVTISGNTLEFDDDPDHTGFLQFDAGRSSVEDTRFAVEGNDSSDPGAGSGGVRTRKRKRPSAGQGGAQPPSPKPAGAGREASGGDPGAGAGAVVGPPPKKEANTAWDEFTEGDAFGASGFDSSYLETKLRQLLRKHVTHGDNGLGVNTFATLKSNLASESASIPAGISGSALDDFLESLTVKGAQSYQATTEKLWVKVGDNATVKLGNVAFTFNDVSNSVDIGTGGYGYNFNDGDSFTENYHKGKDFTVSRFAGEVETYSEFSGSTISDSLELSTSDTKAIKIGAFSEMELFIGGENAMKLELAGKNSMSLMLGLSSEIDVFIGGKMTVEANALPKLEVTIGPSNVEVTIPASTELTVQQVNAGLKLSNMRLDTTEAYLKATMATLSETNAALKKSEAALSDSQAKLKSDVAALSDSQAKLTEKNAALSKDTAALSDQQKVLAWNVKGLALNTTAGVTMLS